ncbi:hypothetical protein, partial [Streptomyces sp. SAJ15]|uniref:hypothetical protein n=1 Tax=Streptomyces sp. SAJ15 TaxID=2011095 RepID=UPI001C9152B6
GRFLRSRFTGPSGRFPSVFPTLPDSFSFRFRSEFVSGWPLEWPLPFGCFDFIRTGPADLIGLALPKNSKLLAGIQFPSRAT